MDEAIDEAMDETEKNSQSVEEINEKVSELGVQVDKNREDAVLERETLGEWIKNMLVILVIVFLVLFTILLVLIITNRNRLSKDYLKLEAKVDNTKDAIDIKMKDVLKKHEEDLATLQAIIEKGKK